MSVKRLLASALLLTELSEVERKDLQKSAATLLLRAQRRKNEKSIVSGIEEEITTWELSSKASGSVAEKVKVVGIIDGLKRELQAQRLRESLATRELENANSDFNMFKVKLSISNPQARKGLEEFRSRMEEVLAHLPNLVSRSER